MSTSIDTHNIVKVTVTDSSFTTPHDFWVRKYTFIDDEDNKTVVNVFSSEKLP